MNKHTILYLKSKGIFTMIAIMIWLDSYGQNVRISDKSNPNESSITMDLKHPEKLIAGSNLNNYFISKDTGRTWSVHKLTSSFGVWGDPVVVTDTLGHVFFFHLSNPSDGNWIDRIVCQKSVNHGTSWTNGTYTGLNGTKAQDKHWCVVDRKNNHLYLTWTQFDKYDSSDPRDKSIILFSKSTDQGSNWSPPAKINRIDGDCLDGDATVEGAVPAVGPEGQIYVAWAGPNGIVFNKSYDEGNTWLDQEIKVDPMPDGWDYDIPGIYRANGLPVTTCDLSYGPDRGTIYVNWSDQRNGADDTDIWLAKSTDEGKTWSKPIRVNDDPPGRHQFFTWMAIDQTTGFLYFVFYDRRNYTDTATDVYMAISKDGGATFSNRKISDTPFIPNENVFFGDYTNIVAHNGIVRPIWTRLDNAQLSILTDITPVERILAAEDTHASPNEIQVFTNYPNPAQDMTFVSYKLRQNTRVSLQIMDIQGNKIKSIIENEQRSYGTYVETMDLRSLQLPAGTYLIVLSTDGKPKIKRQVVLK